MIDFSAPSTKRKRSDKEEQREIENDDKAPNEHPSENSTTQRENLFSESSSSQISESSRNSQLLDQMQSLLNELKLKEKGSSRNEEKSLTIAVDKSNLEEENVEQENRIKVCASLKDIETILKASFFLDWNNQVLLCKICIPNPDRIFVDPAKQTVGIFKIHDVEYERERVQSKQFRH